MIESFFFYRFTLHTKQRHGWLITLSHVVIIRLAHGRLKYEATNEHTHFLLPRSYAHTQRGAAAGKAAKPVRPDEVNYSSTVSVNHKENVWQFNECEQKQSNNSQTDIWKQWCLNIKAFKSASRNLNTNINLRMNIILYQILNAVAQCRIYNKTICYLNLPSVLKSFFSCARLFRILLVFAFVSVCLHH